MEKPCSNVGKKIKDKDETQLTVKAKLDLFMLKRCLESVFSQASIAKATTTATTTKTTKENISTIWCCLGFPEVRWLVGLAAAVRMTPADTHHAHNDDDTRERKTTRI